MKTIGQVLKQARLKKQLDLEELSTITKIRVDYLKAVETDQFDKLPQATFVRGFIQTYAKAVDVDPQNALAILRRDYDQNQKGKIIPRGLTKPIKTHSQIWNPRTSTAIVGLIVAVLVVVYIANQLIGLQAPPTLTLDTPNDNSIFVTNLVEISGNTDPDASLTINNSPITLDLDGNFQTTLDLQQGSHTILIKAESRDGKTTQETRQITVQPEDSQN